MRYRDLFSLSLRAFKTNTSRTILTILGVGVGIAAVLFLVSLGYGLQNVILNQITTADSLLTLDVSSASEFVELNQEKVDVLKNLPEVAETSLTLDLSGQLSSQNEGSLGETSDGLIYLVDNNYFRLSGTNFEIGREFSASDAKEIIVSSAAAKIFGFEDLESMLGQSFKINIFLPIKESGDVQIISLQEHYSVAGVIIDDNTNFAYLPIANVQHLSLPNYSGMKLKVKEESQLNVVRDQIINSGLAASSLSDTIDQTKKIFKIIQIVLGIFGLIALIVSAIGMFNTMTITLLERTREIGIMRAIGVGVKDVAQLFLVESVIMGFLGGVGGVVIGFVAGELFNLMINILASNFGGQSLDLFYCPTWFVLFVLGFSVITGLLTGLYPARRAAKINPLEALRYK